MGLVTKRAEKQNTLHSTLDFAKLLEDTLTSADPQKPLPADIYTRIETAFSIRSAAGASRRIDLDKQGTRLWNLSKTATDVEMVCLGKNSHSQFVYSCLRKQSASLLVSFLTALNDAPKVPLQVQLWFCPGKMWIKADVAPDDVRVLKTCLKTSKYCLDHCHLSLAETVVERAAFYEERLKSHGDVTSQGHSHLVSRLSNDYLGTRIALAWHQDRLDLAKLMLTKMNPGLDDLEPSSVEEFADLFLEIGRSQNKKIQWAEAVYWLEKAHNTLLSQSQELLSSDAGELRISIMHDMARALSNLDTSDSRTKAWNVVRELEIDCGDRLVILLLKLDLLTDDIPNSAQDYCGILDKIVRTVPMTDTNVKSVLHHVHRLRSRSPLMAHRVLCTLLQERLLGTEETKWIEKALVTIIWNCTSSADFLDVLTSLSEVFETLANNGLAQGISPHATHAAQILLWKRIEANYNQEMYAKSEAWCRLSLHAIFSRAGGLNIAKLQRKLMLCALGMSDPAKARDVFSQMSPSNQKDPSSMYLLYKVALRSRDSELAAECIDAICTASNKDATLLYACVLEAQQMGDHLQIARSLQRVLEKCNYIAPSKVHLPALLRCTARLLIRELKACSWATDCADEICKVFEGAAIQAKTLRSSAICDVFSLAELDWFSRNTYNLSLLYCTSWSPEQTLRLVQSCLKFIGLYPATIGLNVMADLSLRRLFCYFLSGSLLVVLARSEENVEQQLQHYTDMRKVINDFRIDVKGQINRLEGGAKDDLQRKHASLLAFDYEAAARLKAWNDFDRLIKESQEFEGPGPKVYGLFADITLSSEAPSEIMVSTLQQIINVTWQQNHSDTEKLSRWVRCLFSLACSEFNIAKQLLDQAVIIAEVAQKILSSRLQHSKSYPAEELEWLASTAFNRAIDFYCTSQDAECRVWAEKALALSNFCEDGGTLHGLLQQKYQGLSWHA